MTTAELQRAPCTMCMYTCVCVCIYIYICIYFTLYYIYIYTQTVFGNVYLETYHAFSAVFASVSR